MNQAEDLRSDGDSAEPVRYATEVIAIGAMVPQFREQGLLVLFAELAPEELHEFVVLHRPGAAHSAPEPGDVVELDGERFVVTSVGAVAEQNLLQLGHISLKADGSTSAPLPGDVCVEVKPLPLLASGSVVRILAANGANP